MRAFPATYCEWVAASNDDDIGEYWIYAVTGAPFDSTDGLEPALILDRTEWGQTLLETVSGGAAIKPDVPMWVAVVSVDSSGNSWMDNLQTSMISPVDENSQDPGIHLPIVTGVMVYWDETESTIEVLWKASDDTQVASYSIYASNMEFSDTREAILVASSITTPNASFDSIGPTPVSPSSPYWLAVVAFDGEVHRLAVDPLEIRPWSESSFGSSEEGEGGASDSWYDQLMNGDLNTLVALVSAVMILIGALLFVKPRQQAAPEPWEMGALEVELEEQMSREAAGLSDDEEDDFVIEDDSQSFTSSPSPELTIDEEEDAPAAAESVIDELLGVSSDDTDLDDLEDMADDLDFDDLGDMADDLDEDDDLDTSFLDDVL